MAETWRAILARVPTAWVLGVTATPERLDGKGLREVFDVLVIGPTVKELIAGGWLSPFVVYRARAPGRSQGRPHRRRRLCLGDLARRMSAGFVLDDALGEYRKHLDGRTAIAFCTTIDHSRTVARFFRAAGVRAQHLDGDTPARGTAPAHRATSDRRNLRSSPTVGFIAEGLDIP